MFIFVIVFIVIIGSLLFKAFTSFDDDNNRVNTDAQVPFRKLANGQRFEKAYLDNGVFTKNGFKATFMMVFSKEHISVDADGFVVEDKGIKLPQIKRVWCETYQRDLTADELNMLFEYISLHDNDFNDQIKVCEPRNA